MTVEDERRPSIAPQAPSSENPLAELLATLRNGGNTPQNRRKAVRAIVTGGLNEETQGDLMSLVEEGWRKLGEESGESKKTGSKIIPGNKLETEGLFSDASTSPT